MENNNMESPKSSAPRMAPWLKNPSTLSNVSGSPPSRTQTEGALAVNPSFQKTHAKKMSAEVYSVSSNSPPASPTTKRKVITEVLHSPTLELVCPELRVSRQFEGEIVNHMDRCPFDVGYYWDQSAEEIEVRVYQQINSNKHKAIPPSAYAAEEGQRRKELLAQKIEARRREEEEENLRKKRLEDEMKKREEEAQRKKEEDEKKAAEDERKKAEDERKKQEQESKKVTGRRVSLTEFPPRRTDSMASDERNLTPSCPIETDSFSLDKTSSSGSAECDFDKMSQKDLEIELEKSYIPTRWRAISSYTAKEKKGLSFKEGEILKVLRRGGGVFWLAEAEKGGARGLVPGYFLEEVEEEKVPGVVIKRKDGKKSLKKKKQRDNALQPRIQASKKDKDPPGSPVVMEVPNVQPASAAQSAAKGRFGAHWMKGKKDKKDKKEKEKKTTLVNWDNLIIGETLSKISAGSGTSIHVCYVDGFQCCMKELNFMVATAQQKRMIRGEIELLESLEPHRNVIRYLHHEEGKTYIRLFLTMYSATLSDLLKKRKDANSPLSAIDICFYCRLCLDGLQFLHGHGIIHRDIKAENVFLILGANGKVLEVALGDFDQAKNLGGGMTVTTIGTVGWMAPEMLVGQGYSFPADIYSFGMLLYEMLSLTIPFEKESQFTLPDKVRQGLKPTIPEEVVDLPGYPELIALQRECIAVEPSERPHLPVLQQRFGEIFGRLLEETEKNSQQAL